MDDESLLQEAQNLCDEITSIVCKHRLSVMATAFANILAYVIDEGGAVEPIQMQKAVIDTMQDIFNQYNKRGKSE